MNQDQEIVARNYFESAAALMMSRMEAMKVSDPSIYAGAFQSLRNGATMSLTTTISGSGVGEVVCSLTLGDKTAVLFSLDTKATKTH